MFSSKKKIDTGNSGMINTIIGENSKIEGLLSASDPARIDGFLKGRILSKSSVIVGEHGVVRGDIKAEEILVAGTVYGNLTAGQRIELTQTGRVLGDMITKTLVIDEGASFKGNCTMEVVEERKSSEDMDFPEEEPEEEIEREESEESEDPLEAEKNPKKENKEK